MNARPERPTRVEWCWVIALLSLALLLRVGFILFEQPGFYFEDSLDYDRAARTFLDTGHFDARYYRFPLYPLVMAASYRLFGPGFLPLRTIQAFFGVATCMCVWILGQRLFGPRAGLLALAGAAVFPVHVVLAGIEYPVILGTFLIWCVLALVAGEGVWEGKRTARLVLAGVGVGLSSMLFEGGWVLGIFLCLWMILGGGGGRLRFRSLAVAGVATLAVLTPWLYVMRKSGDYRALLLRPGLHLPSAPGLNPPMWEGSGENLLTSKLSGLARHPWWTVRHAWSEFIHFWDPYPDRLASADERFREKLHETDPRMVVNDSLVGDLPRLLYAAGFSALLAIAAIGALVAPRVVRGSAFLVAWPIVLGACYAPFFTQMRYRIPADPAFVLLGAYAVDLTLQKSVWANLRESMKALWEGWKRIAEKIAVVQTFILLFLLFVVGIGPIALLMKLFRKDPMHAPQAAGSFWALRERVREGMQECLKQF
jgi:4-amino-4-deoxy-L-arabinose transferase-like glycosyltransferase